MQAYVVARHIADFLGAGQKIFVALEQPGFDFGEPCRSAFAVVVQCFRVAASVLSLSAST